MFTNFPVKLLPLRSPKGFSASKCDVGNWIFSKFKDFFEKLLGKFLDFVGEFFGGFFGRMFLGGFFGRNSSGGILTLLKSVRLFEYGRN